MEYYDPFMIRFSCLVSVAVGHGTPYWAGDVSEPQVPWVAIGVSAEPAKCGAGGGRLPWQLECCHYSESFTFLLIDMEQCLNDLII